MVCTNHAKLSIVRQCALLDISRSGLYYTPKGESAFTLTLMQEIDRAFTEWPFLGVRQMRDYLVLLGHGVGKKRVRRLMRLMGLEPVYQKPRTSIPHPEHKRYPYLLRDLSITRPNQVWCADITYIPMRKGFLYLAPIMDWYSRKVLSWRLSNTMDADFCVSALEEALAKYGKPDIFNTDQGSQFTSSVFTNVLRENGIRSPWTARDAGWTTSSSNDSGARSNTKMFTCTLTKPARKPVQESKHGLVFTTDSGLTAAWADCPRTGPMNKAF